MIIVSKKSTYKNYYQQLHKMTNRLASYKARPGTKQQDILRGDRRSHVRESTPFKASTLLVLRDSNIMD